MAGTEITKQQKIMLAVLGVIGFYMFYSKVYVPTNKKIDKASQELESFRRKLRQTRAKARRLDQLKAEFETVQLRLKSLEKRLPRREEISTLIRWSTDIARKHGMEIPALNISAPVTKPFYTEHIFRMSLTAPYHNLARFFSEMGQGERILAIHNLSLKPASRKEEEARRELKASFELVAFTYRE